MLSNPRGFNLLASKSFASICPNKIVCVRLTSYNISAFEEFNAKFFGCFLCLSVAFKLGFTSICDIFECQFFFCGMVITTFGTIIEAAGSLLIIVVDTRF